MMQDILQAIHTQFEKGYQSAQETGLQYASKEFNRIILVGMGGSALVGELLLNLSREAKNPLPVTVHRDYGLPEAPLRENALIIISSHSGDTQETLDAYSTAIRMKLPVIVISSGGELVKRTEADLTPLAFIRDQYLPPRKSIGYQLGALMKILENLNIIPSQEKFLLSLKDDIQNHTYETQAKGRELAKQIKDSTPLIFASSKYSAVAYIMQILINENANSLAFSGIFPEINHNILMGYDQMQFGQFYTIILQGDDEDPRIQKRQECTAQVIRENNGIVSILKLEGDNAYNKIFNGIMIGNWMAVYLAEHKHVDPIAIPILTNFKSQMD